jgi:hypothetical protein
MNNVVNLRPEQALRAVEQLREKADNSGRPPTSGGGGPTLEARIAKLEATMDHVQNDVTELKADVRELRRDLSTDFRILFGAIIAVALGLAGLMAKGFEWL